MKEIWEPLKGKAKIIIPLQTNAFICKCRLGMWEMAVTMFSPPSSVFLSLSYLRWVLRHRWVWGFRPVQARRTVCEHLRELWMLLYGRIRAKERAWAFPPNQRCHVVYRWVSATECRTGRYVSVGGDFLLLWARVCVCGSPLGMWVETICSFAHLYELWKKANNITKIEGARLKS